MVDVARTKLDEDIARVDETRSMLEHMADVIENEGPPQRGGETYKDDAVAALRHGAQIAAQSRKNLKAVAMIYDAKVAGES